VLLKSDFTIAAGEYATAVGWSLPVEMLKRVG